MTLGYKGKDVLLFTGDNLGRKRAVMPGRESVVPGYLLFFLLL